MNVRASVEPLDDGFGIVLGAWRRDCGIAPGDTVDVTLRPEGPQRENLADDVRAALAAEPDASVFFDALAQFYRRSYLRWIDAPNAGPTSASGGSPK
ncbi:MAG: YdeI/OmpD-associated family protein, partial [Acidimicrobiia bacterium]